MNDAFALYSYLSRAGVFLERTEDEQLRADNLPCLTRFAPSIVKHKAAMLSLVALRDATFLSWIAHSCMLTKRASTRVDYLWRKFDLYATSRGYASSREEFERLIATQFQMERGMVTGVCIAQDWDSYQAAYVSPATTPPRIGGRGIKKDFLNRDRAA